MNSLIKIKGNNNGLLLTIDNANADINIKTDFEQIKQAISQKLASCAHFFEPNTIITLNDKSFSSVQQQDLVNIFKQYDLILKCNAETAHKIAKDTKAVTHPDKIIKRTIRGGEEIVYKGSIIIHGNINPGAKVVAGGNIDVHGHCRGIVHAGAFGDDKAFIIADILSPLQIRIGGLISRSPDNVDTISARSPFTEKAIIKNGNIILEPFKR